jgi:hypothetical protein
MAKKAAKKGSPKAKKAGGAKRPLSGYMKFCQAERPALMKAHPAWKITDAAKELGKRWKALSADKQNAYK